MSLLFPQWPCGLSRAVAVAVAGRREAAPSALLQNPPGAEREQSRCGTVAGERWFICVGCWMLRSSGSAEGRSWIAAGRWMGAEVLQGGFYK